ncbi:hypothetical protein JL721_7995 [Aureococcus anophagefferens]|nr:hypothetical protein JL721_7995 [Aureococcus anophagefferens]
MGSSRRTRSGSRTRRSATPRPPPKGPRTLLLEALDWKAAHATKVVLVRVGEFYEAWGVDAVMLVEHCGLNAMGDKVRAGCPWRNLQATLDGLTAVGLSVAVYEERPDGDRKKRKVRYLSQVVTPASRTYVSGSNLERGDIDFGGVAPKFFGVATETAAGGHALVSLDVDARLATVRRGVTPGGCRAAVFCDGGAAAPAFFFEGADTEGASRAMERNLRNHASKLAASLLELGHRAAPAGPAPAPGVASPPAATDGDLARALAFAVAADRNEAPFRGVVKRAVLPDAYGALDAAAAELAAAVPDDFPPAADVVYDVVNNGLSFKPAAGDGDGFVAPLDRHRRPQHHKRTSPRVEAALGSSPRGDAPVFGKSAFAVEMDDLAQLLDECTARSLVLVDELGRGTSAREGAAVGAAVLCEFRERGYTGVFATHLHEILDVLGGDAPATLKPWRMGAGGDGGAAFRVEAGVCTDSRALEAGRWRWARWPRGAAAFLGRDAPVAEGAADPLAAAEAALGAGGPVLVVKRRVAKESEIPNFKASFLGRFPLVNGPPPPARWSCVYAFAASYGRRAGRLRRRDRRASGRLARHDATYGTGRPRWWRWRRASRSAAVIRGLRRGGVPSSTDDGAHAFGGAA